MIDLKNLKQRYFISYALFVGLFFILFLWRFWENGNNVFGINLTFLWLLVIGYFILVKWQTLTKKTLLWLVPFILIVFSFSFYKNPYTTWISFLLAPVIFFIFTTHESHKAIQNIFWSKFMPIAFIFSGFKFLTSLILGLTQKDNKKTDHSIKLSNQVLENKNLGSIIGQVVFGLVILILISFGVVIPLLSSADQNFANIFKDLLDKFFDLFSAVTIAKIFVMGIITVILLGALHYWRRILSPFNTKISNENFVSKNSIMIGIVLSGVFFLYLIFIAIQIQNLFTDLPINDFSETVSTVKTGFWQLFLLTIINIIFFALVFKKYAKGVQLILIAFTVSSLLLIISAGHRVFLYVSNYGLSYEKLFAFYTVVFCSLVFIWFISLFFSRSEERVNIIKNLTFFALWMYAFLTIMPLEKIIFSTNLSLTQKEGSHVNINELKMLGFDALSVVERNYDKLIEEARKDYLQQQEEYKIKYPDSYSNDHDENKGVLHELNFGEEERKEKEIRDKEKAEKDLENSVDIRWNNWVSKLQKDMVYVDIDYVNNCKEENNSKYSLCVCDEGDKNSDCKGFINKKWYEKTFGEIFYKPLKKFEKKEYDYSYLNENSENDETNEEVTIKTFKNNVQGFSFDYSSDLKLDYDDADTVEELKNKGQYLVRIRYSKTGENIYIMSLDKDFEYHNKLGEDYIKLANDLSKGDFVKVFLPNLKKYSNYVISHTDKKGDIYNNYKILVNADKRVFVIGSYSIQKNIGDLSKINTDQYVKAITPSKELQDVIKSFKIIDA